MKKILLFLLLCTSIAGCVKNEESASVTALRDARARQLAALATLSEAQAASALIQANAEKQLRESEAAINLAMAEYQKALAAQQQTVADRAKLDLDKARALYESEVATLKATAELARRTAEKALRDYLATIAADAVLNPNLAALTQAYQTEMDSWNQQTTDLIAAKQALIEARIGVGSIKATKEKEIADQNVIVITNQALISAYKQLSTADKEAVKRMLDANSLKLIPAQEADTKNLALFQLQTNNMLNLQTAFRSVPYLVAANALALTNPSLVTMRYISTETTVKQDYIAPDGSHYTLWGIPYNAYTIVERIDEGGLSTLVSDYNGQLTTEEQKVKTAKNLMDNADALTESRLAPRNTAVENLPLYTAERDRAYALLTQTKTTYIAAGYDAANVATLAAIRARIAATTDQAELALLRTAETAWVDQDAAQLNVNQANQAIADYNTASLASTQARNQYNLAVTLFETWQKTALTTRQQVATLIDPAAQKEYLEALTNYQDGDVDYQNSWIESSKSAIDLGYYTQMGKALTKAYEGFTDIETLIIEAMTAIEAAQVIIEDVSAITTQEQLIAYSQAAVDNLNKAVEIAQNNMTKLKAAIEAELKK